MLFLNDLFMDKYFYVGLFCYFNLLKQLVEAIKNVIL